MDGGRGGGGEQIQKLSKMAEFLLFFVGGGKWGEEPPTGGGGAFANPMLHLSSHQCQRVMEFFISFLSSTVHQ